MCRLFQEPARPRHCSSIVVFAGGSVRVRFDRFTLDTDRRQLIRDTENVHLSPKAFDLLALLVQHQPKALAKTELLAQIWPSTFVADGSLAVVVAEIRAALGDVPRRSRYVRTVRLCLLWRHRGNAHILGWIGFGERSNGEAPLGQGGSVSGAGYYDSRARG